MTRHNVVFSPKTQMPMLPAEASVHLRYSYLVKHGAVNTSDWFWCQEQNYFPAASSIQMKLCSDTLYQGVFMNKTSRKTIALSGCETRKPRDFRVLLNYYIAVLLNQSKLNPNQLPIHYCNPSVYPDYLAMNTEPGKFHHSPLTGLAFYSYDYTFDRQDGLYNAIHYNNKRQLASYKEKYKDLPFVIAPDYSIFDDIWRYENEYRLFKTRILMLWFELEIGAVVIPNAIYVAPDKMPLYYSGLENCSVICFSTKGHIRRAESRNRVKEAVQFVTDNMTNLNTILVYSVCGNDHNSLRLFQYAAERGIQILIVDNTLRQRNKALMKRRADHE